MNSAIDEKKFEKTYSVKRVTFEDKSNKTCTSLESAKRRNTELIKVTHPFKTFKIYLIYIFQRLQFKRN